jgi:Protein of unknown function (DUF2971)
MSSEVAQLDLYKPGWLCHFTTAEAAFQHIVPTRRLRMSPYRAMSDPLESKVLHFGWAGPGEPEDLKVFDQVRVSITRNRDARRLLSFTVDRIEQGVAPPWGLGWARARMWQQYADDHAGVCLVFDRARADKQLVAAMNGPSTLMSGPVRYAPGGFTSSDTQVLRAADFMGLDDNGLTVATEQFVATHGKDLFLLKDTDWSTEEEFRYVLMVDHQEPVYLDFGDSLVAAIVGERFPEWQLPAATQICREANVELRQLLWRDGRPWPASVADTGPPEPRGEKP